MNSLSVFRPMSDLLDAATDFERRFMMDDYPNTRNSHLLNIDVDVQDDNYIIKAEVPGIKEDDVSIGFENGMVTIEAEYKEESDNVFRQGKYSRSFSLRDVDADKAVASLKDGILTIMLPKSEAAKARKIQITK